MKFHLKIIYTILLCASLFSISPLAFASDAYDPFIDYSEYDDNGDEEADVNFFKNGRQFSMQVLGGYTGLTGIMGSQVWDGAISYGLGINFFLDLRIAIQAQYIRSNHNMLVTVPSSLETLQASTSFSDISVSLKYYINTQNIIRNLAKFNPYFMLGFSYVIRETASNDSSSALFDKTRGYGANFGGGIELPLSNKKFFVGAEGVYQLINFADEGTELKPNGVSTGIVPSGDMYRFSGILGMNF